MIVNNFFFSQFIWGAHLLLDLWFAWFSWNSGSLFNNFIDCLPFYWRWAWIVWRFHMLLRVAWDVCLDPSSRPFHETFESSWWIWPVWAVDACVHKLMSLMMRFSAGTFEFDSKRFVNWVRHKLEAWDNKLVRVDSMGCWRAFDENMLEVRREVSWTNWVDKQVTIFLYLKYFSKLKIQVLRVLKKYVLNSNLQDLQQKLYSIVNVHAVKAYCAVNLWYKFHSADET